MNIGRFVGHLMIMLLIVMVIFVVIRFVGQRNEYGYIGPDTESNSYRALMSGLNSWNSYLSGSTSGLSQTQSYFRRAIDQNRDTVLGNTLANNMNKVNERSQLETVQLCVYAVRSINQTRQDIDNSYDQLTNLLQSQIQLIPTVLLGLKNTKSISCVKDYFGQIKDTSMLLVETSTQRGKRKQEYSEAVNNYPKILGSCDTIMTIQQQSDELKQQLNTMIYEYNLYREILDDPSRHGQLCQGSPQPSMSGLVQKMGSISLKPLGNNIQQAINSIKQSMTSNK